ncbi:fatty acid desaturase-domain-containing protein [Hyaloraphidium curvatum]|nr:fatty acid desaturase-domain-containing protein [Hyaloraphidium curvatum]
MAILRTRTPAALPSDAPAAKPAATHPPTTTGRTQPRDGDLPEGLPLPPKELVYAHIAKFARADWYNAALWLIPTLGSFLLGLYHCHALPVYAWPLFALVRLRLFVIFHDVAHLSFFPSRAANYVLGTLLGAAVWSPFELWRDGHQTRHHAIANNMDESLNGQTASWTLQEWKKKPRWQKIAYAAFYNRYLYFTVVPYLLFVWTQHIYATWLELSLQTLWALSVFHTIGWRGVAFDHGTAWLVYVAGVLITHIEHTFEGAYRRRGGDWSKYGSGMLGSSYLPIPWWLSWATNGIEYHHIHHLNTRVPCYHLAECHFSAGALFDAVPRITVREFLGSFGWNAWDEENRRFVDVADHWLVADHRRELARLPPGCT